MGTVGWKSGYGFVWGIEGMGAWLPYPFPSQWSPCLGPPNCGPKREAREEKEEQKRMPQRP